MSMLWNRIFVVLIAVIISLPCCGRQDKSQSAVELNREKPAGSSSKRVSFPTKNPVEKSVTRVPQAVNNVRALFEGIPEYPGADIVDFSDSKSDQLKRRGSTNSIMYTTYDMYNDVCRFYGEELAQFRPSVMSVPTGRGKQNMYTFKHDGRNISVMVLNDEEENIVRIMYSIGRE